MLEWAITFDQLRWSYQLWRPKSVTIYSKERYWSSSKRHNLKSSIWVAIVNLSCLLNIVVYLSFLVIFKSGIPSLSHSNFPHSSTPAEVWITLFPLLKMELFLVLHLFLLPMHCLSSSVLETHARAGSSQATLSVLATHCRQSISRLFKQAQAKAFITDFL